MATSPPPLLTSLTALAPEERVAFCDHLSGAPKSIIVVQYMDRLIQAQAPYSHKQALEDLYGVRPGQQEYRRTYQAYVKQLREVHQKLQAWLLEGEEARTDAPMTLTDAERHYYIGRTHYRNGQVESALVQLREAWKSYRHGTDTEHIGLEIAASLVVCLMHVRRLEEMPVDIREAPASILRDALLYDAWAGMHLLNNVAATAEHRTEIAHYRTLLDELSALSILQDRTAVLDLLHAYIDKTDAQWRSDTTAEREANERVTAVHASVDEFGYSYFRRGSVRDEGDAMKLFNEFDDERSRGNINAAMKCIAEAYLRMPSTTPSYEYFVNTYTSFLVSAVYPTQLTTVLAQFVPFLQEKKFAFYLAVQNFFVVLRDLLAAQQIDVAESLAVVATLDEHVGDTRRGVAAVIRGRAFVYHRVRDSSAVDALYDQLVRMRGGEQEVVTVRHLVKILKYDLDRSRGIVTSPQRLRSALDAYLKLSPDQWGSKLLPIVYLGRHAASAEINEWYRTAAFPTLADQRYLDARERVEAFIALSAQADAESAP